MARRILIVDDEFGLADVIGELLREHGFEVAIAINGKVGLVCLQQQRADLVLVDSMMPVIDGPEMIRRMRADPELARIPVVLMSAMPEAVPTGDGALHDAALIKPFALEEMLAVIARFLPGDGA